MTPLTKGSNVPLTATRLRVRVLTEARPAAPTVDASALLLTDSGRVRDDADFVFFNAPVHGSGAVRLAGDVLEVDTAAVEGAVERVVVVASADGGTFGAVAGLAMLVQDASTGAEVARFDVPAAGEETAMVLGEVYRRAGAWKLRAVGQGYAAGLAGLATDFGITVDDEPAAATVPAVSLKKQKLVALEKSLEQRGDRQLLDLTKRAAVSLEKRGLGEHTARVAICLDISGSMASLYRRGTVQALAERVLALGMRFDDDASIDCFLFGKRAHQAGAMSPDSYTGHVAAALNQHGLEPGTAYGAAMQMIRTFYFGAADPRSAPLAPTPGVTPVYVMFLTDGATQDEEVTREQVRASSYEPLFWQFMAIGRREDFRFLTELDDMDGRLVDNADFFSVADPSTVSDEELFDLLMTEYPGWLGRARAAGLLSGG